MSKTKTVLHYKIEQGMRETPVFQEVKIQGILLAEITSEMPTKQLLEILQIREHYYDFWVNSLGNRIDPFNVLQIKPEELPIKLWQFVSKRDLELSTEMENENLSDI